MPRLCALAASCRRSCTAAGAAPPLHALGPCQLLQHSAVQLQALCASPRCGLIVLHKRSSQRLLSAAQLVLQACTVAAMAAATVYSGFLISRLCRAVPDAVIFGDIGDAALGRRGRSLSYAVIYATDATRCIILHLAATQASPHK